MAQTIIDSSLTKLQMEKIFETVGRSEYVRNVYAGKPIIPGRTINSNCIISITRKEEPFVCHDTEACAEAVADHENFLKEINDSKTNPLFERALTVIREAAKFTPYHWKEFFRMTLLFGAFSFFGREDFSMDFKETPYVIEIRMQYIDPSHDEPDLEGKEVPVIHNNRKYTSIIYNKKTGIVAKSEINNGRTNSTFVWDCKTGRRILTRVAILSKKFETEEWYEKIVDNIFYEDNYVSAVECIKGKSCGVDLYPVPVEAKEFVIDPVVFKTFNSQRGNNAPRNNNASHGNNASRGSNAPRNNNASHGNNAHRNAKPQKRPTAKDFPAL